MAKNAQDKSIIAIASAQRLAEPYIGVGRRCQTTGVENVGGQVTAGLARWPYKVRARPMLSATTSQQQCPYQVQLSRRYSVKTITMSRLQGA
eukprot:4448403-Amphidinium_carterae.1